MNDRKLTDFISAKELQRKKVGQENFELIIAGHSKPRYKGKQRK